MTKFTNQLLERTLRALPERHPGEPDQPEGPAPKAKEINRTGWFR